ncbi:MAG: hypothetical protein WC665_08880 [Sulfurimonas sp.]|jgi:hypothetical protein
MKKILEIEKKAISFFKQYCVNLILFSVVFLLVIFVYGSIPFVSMPTLGQAVWASGFAESFAKEDFAIYATHFGLPEKAPIAFGLAGVFLQSLYIKYLHLQAGDAYSLVSVTYLLLAAFGTIKFSMFLGTTLRTSIIASAVYLTLPLVWWHSLYSFLSFGFALMPLYIYIVFFIIKNKLGENKYIYFTFFLISILAVFTDGYTFVMFALSYFLILFFSFVSKKIEFKKVAYLFLYAMVVFLISYVLYTNYINESSFNIWSMDYYRGFGIDLTMLFSPSKEIFWLYDLLGLSVERTSVEFFGDDSVWAVSFSLALLVFALMALFFVKNEYKMQLLMIALFGFYLSLGPSLKINSKRPIEEISIKNFDGAMKQEYAIAPTGNEFLYQYIPGIKNMRATYRWIGLFQVALFGLLIILLSKLESQDKRYLAYSILILLAALNIPDPSVRLKNIIYNRDSMMQMDKDLVSLLKQHIKANSKVAFVPYYNDHFANYLAAKSDIRTYNVGGDKNLELAMKNWPQTMLTLSEITVPSKFIYNIENILLSKDADYIIFPYFDMLWGAYEWPREDKEIISKKLIYSEYVNYFKNNPNFDLIETEYFSFISISKNADLKYLQNNKEKKICESKNSICFDAKIKELTFSNVGVLKENVLSTNAQDGALLFGPYLPLQKGEYSFEVYGKVSNQDAMFIQISDNLGKSSIGFFKDFNMTGEHDTILKVDNLVLEKDFNAVEITIAVSKDTKAEIYGYRLINKIYLDKGIK